MSLRQMLSRRLRSVAVAGIFLVGGLAGAAAPAFAAPRGTAPATSANVHVLARIVAAEEGDRTLRDQTAVAAVVLNRLHVGGFGHTLRQVIFARGQFTSVSNGYFWDAPVTARSLTAARRALAGVDPTGGALYFYDPGPGVTSRWIYTRLVTNVIDRTVYAI